MQPPGDSSPEHPSSSSRLSAKRRLSFSHHLGETHSAGASEPTSHASQDIFAELPSQSKRQKTLRSSPSSGSSNNPKNSMAQVARRDVIDLTKDTVPAPNFQPQTGIRKLVIKNLRKTSRTNLKDHYNYVWAEISSALTAVYAGQQPRQPLERLYRNVEDICRNGQAKELFQHLNENCVAHLQDSLLPQILAEVQPGLGVVETLQTVYNGWEIWSSRSV
jgi:cullin-4